MTKEQLEQLENIEYLFTVSVGRVIYSDVRILNNPQWRDSISNDYQVISYKQL